MPPRRALRSGEEVPAWLHVLSCWPVLQSPEAKCTFPGPLGSGHGAVFCLSGFPGLSAIECLQPHVDAALVSAVVINTDRAQHSGERIYSVAYSSGFQSFVVGK